MPRDVDELMDRYERTQGFMDLDPEMVARIEAIRSRPRGRRGHLPSPDGTLSAEEEQETALLANLEEHLNAYEAIMDGAVPDGFADGPEPVGEAAAAETPDLDLAGDIDPPPSFAEVDPDLYEQVHGQEREQLDRLQERRQEQRDMRQQQRMDAAGFEHMEELSSQVRQPGDRTAPLHVNTWTPEGQMPAHTVEPDAGEVAVKTKGAKVKVAKEALKDGASAAAHGAKSAVKHTPENLRNAGVTDRVVGGLGAGALMAASGLSTAATGGRHAAQLMGMGLNRVTFGASNYLGGKVAAATRATGEVVGNAASSTYRRARRAMSGDRSGRVVSARDAGPEEELSLPHEDPDIGDTTPEGMEWINEPEFQEILNEGADADIDVEHAPLPGEVEERPLDMKVKLQPGKYQPSHGEPQRRLSSQESGANAQAQQQVAPVQQQIQEQPDRPVSAPPGVSHQHHQEQQDAARRTSI